MSKNKYMWLDAHKVCIFLNLLPWFEYWELWRFILEVILPKLVEDCSLISTLNAKLIKVDSERKYFRKLKESHILIKCELINLNALGNDL